MISREIYNTSKMVLTLTETHISRYILLGKALPLYNNQTALLENTDTIESSANILFYIAISLSCISVILLGSLYFNLKIRIFSQYKTKNIP
jgi:hypothetical protein